MIANPTNHFEVLCRFFEDRQLRFDPHPEDFVVVSGFSFSTTTVHFVAHAPPDAELVTMALTLPARVPADRHAATGQLLHRINQNLRGGAFVLDYDSDQVSVIVHFILDPGQLLTLGLVDRGLTCASLAVDSFFPSVMKVAFSGASPGHALEQGEAELEKRIAQFVERSERQNNDS